MTSAGDNLVRSELHERIKVLPPQKRRQALALLEKREEILHYNKLDQYKPYKKQLEFHGCTARERLFEAGNQLGKTYAGGAEVSYHLTGLYPDWWKGRRFNSPVKIWVAGESGESTRDNPQRILFGEIGDWGSGLIPKHLIGKNSLARGVSDLIDNCAVKHVSGKDSRVFFKSYGKGREKWQGETIHGVWFDEEPPPDVYSEGMTRTNKYLGFVMVTFTPLKGMSDVVMRFYKTEDVNRSITKMTIYDVVDEEHGIYTAEQAEDIINSYPEYEREARAFGNPMLGSGRLFPISEEVIKVGEDYVVPARWPKIIGIDFGWGDHPTAAVKASWDKDSDRIVITDCYRRSERENFIEVHAAAIRAMGGNKIPVAWPHDGNSAGRFKGGSTVMEMYRDAGLNMIQEHASFDTGGFALIPSIKRLFERMKTGRLKVFNHLSDWFEEFRMYHMKNGKVNDINDDLLSATRYLEMMLRYAEQVYDGHYIEEEDDYYATGRNRICGY